METEIKYIDNLCVKITDGSHFSPEDDEKGQYPMYSVKDMKDVLAIFETLKVGQEIDSKNIILKETDDNYFFNNGVKKAKGSYIITELKPATTLEESKVVCKVKDEVLFTEIPVLSIKL